jgi:fatty acid desaturase
MTTANQSADQAQPQRTSAAAPFKLSKVQLQGLSQISPWRSIYHIALEWGAVVLAATLCQHCWNPLLYALTVAWIGARQHALLILMHEGTHYRLFRQRRLNDWVTEVLLAWPHLATMRAYRPNHLAHHNFVNGEHDPDWQRKQDNPEWQFPQSARSLLGIMLRDLCGLGGLKLISLARSLAAAERAPSKAFTRLRLAFYLSLLAAIIAVGGGRALLLYWLVPYFSWLILIMRIRSIAEHFAIERRADAYGHTRTTRAGLLARLFIAPKNVNYHIEHHFFPSVPFYRLPQLHALLMDKPEFAGAAHITGSYLKLIGECLRQPDFIAPELDQPLPTLALAAR